MKLNYVILLSLLVLSGAFAQSYRTCKADRNFVKPDYGRALKQYKKLYKKNNTNELRLKVAECYRMLDSLEQAADWYKLAVNSGRVEAQYVYNYGQVLRMLGRYSDAKVQFERYNVLEPGKNGEILALSCDLVDKFKKDSARYSITPVSFNSESDDFSALQYEDGLIYASSRYDKKKDLYDWYSKPSYYDLYFAKSQSSPTDSAGNNAVALKGRINSYFHEGPGALTDSASTMYFTSSRRSAGTKRVDKKGFLHFQIYSARKSRKGKWKHIKCFPHNSRHYSLGHPTISADGSRMIFTSNLAGGYGGFDLYICYREENKWGKPINLGSKVNSPGNEMFPRFGPDNKLYFASDGQMGLGGFDLYVSTETQEGWGSVTNLGYPINTRFDDFSLELTSGNTGYFSSNRKGGKGMDDIYYVTVSAGKEEKEKTFAQADTGMILLVGNIVNPMNDKAEGGVDVTLVDKLTNTSEKTKTDADGYFSFEVAPESIYELKMFKDSLSNKNLDFNTLGVDGGDTITFSDIIIEGILLKDIYYGYNEYKILPTAYPILDSIVAMMKEKPEVTVDIGGHTDCRGSFAYNLELSWKRANAAQEYLVSKGISANRITLSAFGEQHILNKCRDGVQCTEEQHRVNRRTVLKILKPVGF
ncbi:MAG TPA: OmpA family protein [Chitinophagales bacterium]|nr:OmpA family protein [Chitinophagales bacterium]